MILHWPTGSADMGHFGISFLELLILFEQWAGHRLLSEKVTQTSCSGWTSYFQFPLFLFQREWKFDMGVSLSAVFLGRWVSWPVVWAGSCLSGWYSPVQAASFRVESMFSRSYF